MRLTILPRQPGRPTPARDCTYCAGTGLCRVSRRTVVWWEEYGLEEWDEPCLCVQPLWPTGPATDDDFVPF